MSLLELTRTTHLTAEQRTVLEAILAAEARARSEVESLMTNEVRSAQDFEWLRRLRYAVV